VLEILVTIAVVYYRIHPNHGFIRVIIKYANKLPVHRYAASAQFRTQITIVIFWQFIIFGGALAPCAPPKHTTASHKANARSERRDEEHMTSL
jgi:hypothetical protein